MMKNVPYCMVLFISFVVLVLVQSNAFAKPYQKSKCPPPHMMERQLQRENPERRYKYLGKVEKDKNQYIVYFNVADELFEFINYTKRATLDRLDTKIWILTIQNWDGTNSSQSFVLGRAAQNSKDGSDLSFEGFDFSFEEPWEESHEKNSESRSWVDQTMDKMQKDSDRSQKDFDNWLKLQQENADKWHEKYIKIPGQN